MKSETKWLIDQAHSEITFKAKHLMIAHIKGTFTVFDASIYTTGKDFTTAQIDVWIDSSSIFTGDANRDEHLRNIDFFDVKNHKQITFTSRTIGKADSDGNHELWGELTIKGITRNIKLDVQFGGIIIDPLGNEKAGFTITGTVKRNDWDLVWNTALDAGGFVIGDEILISCDIELTNAGKNHMIVEIIEASTFDNEVAR